MSPRQSPPPEPSGGVHAVRVIDNDWIELPDGVRLAIRLWLPEDADGERPVSAILDSVPYRKSDGTAIYDAAWGTYFAAHGFAFARVDLRGSGDSTGILEDEYTEQEPRDVEQVIAWRSSLIDGAVGMIGVSWGGLRALPNTPPSPTARVVSIHAARPIRRRRSTTSAACRRGHVPVGDLVRLLSSRRTAGGGDVVATGMARAARRRKGRSSAVASHQRRDGYWQRGSACGDLARSIARCSPSAAGVMATGTWCSG